MAIWNPGEPVFDMNTGDIVIDPTTGDAVVVTDGGVWTDPVTGAVYQRDDVTNACYYRVNAYSGEVLRDQSKGVDFINTIFGSPPRFDLIEQEIRATVLDTPGVAAMTDARVLSRSVGERSVVMAFRLRKRGGAVVPAVVTAG